MRPKGDREASHSTSSSYRARTVAASRRATASEEPPHHFHVLLRHRPPSIPPRRRGVAPTTTVRRAPYSGANHLAQKRRSSSRLVRVRVGRAARLAIVGFAGRLYPLRGEVLNEGVPCCPYRGGFADGGPRDLCRRRYERQLPRGSEPAGLWARD